MRGALRYRLYSILLMLLVFSSAIPQLIIQITQSEGTNIIITSPTVWENQTIVITGNLIIESNLTLINTTILMNITSNGQYNIYVEPGGALWLVNNSVIESMTQYSYVIYVMEGGELYCRDSTLKQLGYGTTAGIDVSGNSTHKGRVELHNTVIQISSFTNNQGILEIYDSVVNGTASIDLLYLDTSGILKVYNTEFNVLGDVTPRILSINYYDEIRVEITNITAIGSFSSVIYSRQKYVTSNRAYITLKNSYIEFTTTPQSTPILIRDTNLTITNTTINASMDDSKHIIDLDYTSVDLYITGSKITGGRSAIYYHGVGTSSREAIIKDSILDKGISISVRTGGVGISLESLTIENVSNTQGEPLIFYKDTTPPSIITSGYQIILVNTRSSTEINGLKLDSIIQPVIIMNSTITLKNTTIIDNHVPALDNDYTTAILGLNDASIYIYNSTIQSLTPQGTPTDYTIYLFNADLLDIRDSVIESRRETCIQMITSKDTRVYIRDSNFTIQDKTALLTKVNPPAKPYIYFYNTTWKTPSSSYPSYFHISGELIIEKTNIDFYTTGPYLTSIHTVFNLQDNALIYVKDSHIIARDGTIAWISGINTNLTITDSILEMKDIYQSFIYDLVTIDTDETYVNITRNKVYGPGTGYSVGFIKFSTDLVSSEIYIIDNNVTGLPCGIYFTSEVKTPYKAHIIGNNFTDMGGIWFEEGSNALQYIEDNIIAGEEILYIANSANLTINESSKNIGQVIIVNSQNIVLENITLDNIVVGVTILGSSDIVVNNVSVNGVQSGLHAILVYNSTNITMEYSIIHYSPLPRLGSYKGIVEINSVADIWFKYMNISMAQTPYVSISGKSIIHITDSSSTYIMNSTISSDTTLYIYSIYTASSETSIAYTLIDGGTDSYGVYITDSSITNIYNTVIRGRYGINAYYGSIVNIVDTCIETSGNSISLLNGGVGRIINSTIYAENYYTVRASTNWLVVKNTRFYNRGLYLSDSSRILMEDTLINVSNGVTAISLTGTEQVYIVNTTITTVQGSSGWGLTISNSNHIFIVNSTIENFYINIRLSSSEIYLSNTEIKYSQYYGIHEYYGTNSLTGYYLWIHGNGNTSSTKYDGIYVVSSSTIEIHYSNITSSGRLGVYAEGYANMTYNYWGSSNGPELLDDASLADWIDPEEILDPGNESLTGNNIGYQPYINQPVTRENIAPWGYIEAPLNNSVLKGLVNINITGGDNEGVYASIILIDDRLEAIIYGTNTSYSWDTTTVEDGFHKITLLTIDYAGNLNETIYYYKVSNIHPMVSILSPENYTWVSGKSYPIEIYGSDNNPYKMMIYVNDVLKRTYYGSYATGYITYLLDTTSYPDGSLIEVKAVLTDLDGYSDTDILYLYVDNNPPQASITSPPDNSIVPGRITCTIDVGDAEAFNYAELYINDTLYYNTTIEGIHDIEVDLSNYTDNSLLEFRLVAYDVAGNTNTTSSYYILDLTPPSIDIVSPIGDTVSEVVLINTTAYDLNNVSRIEIYIDDVLVYSEDYIDRNEVYATYEWNTTEYTDGPHNVTIIAYDTVGNKNQETRIYYVSNGQPIPETREIILFTIILTLIASLTLLYRTRTDRKTSCGIIFE